MNNEKTLIKAERYKETENIIKNKILVDNSCIYNFSFHTVAALSRVGDLKIFCPNWGGISEYRCQDRRTHGRQLRATICQDLRLLVFFCANLFWFLASDWEKWGDSTWIRSRPAVFDVPDRRHNLQLTPLSRQQSRLSTQLTQKRRSNHCWAIIVLPGPATLPAQQCPVEWGTARPGTKQPRGTAKTNRNQLEQLRPRITKFGANCQL